MTFCYANTSSISIIRVDRYICRRQNKFKLTFSQTKYFNFYCVLDIIEENIRSRESAAEQAETLIDSGVEQFMRDLKVLDAVKTITEVRTHVHDLKDEQLVIALKKLSNGADAEQVLRQFAHTFTNKVLHAPTVSMRQASADGRLDVLDWSRELFNLNKFESSK